MQRSNSKKSKADALKDAQKHIAKILDILAKALLAEDKIMEIFKNSTPKNYSLRLGGVICEAFRVIYSLSTNKEL